MKNIYQYIILIALSFAAVIPNVQGNEPPVEATDTIVINIDNNSKIIILISDKSQLEKLKTYDLNAMIRDISASVDTAKNEDFVQIEDNSGEKYFSDSTKNETIYYDNTTEFRVGNYEIAVDNDELEDAGIQTSTSDESEKSYKYRDRKTRHSFNFEFGLNNYLEDGKYPDGSENYAVKSWGSWFVGLSSIQRTHIGRGMFYLEWGAKLNWYNFKLDNRWVQILKTDNGTEYLPPPTGVDGIKSKLTASYINASVVPVIDFSKGRRKVKRFESPGVSISRYKRQGFRLGFGGYAGYRLGSHTKYKFKFEGDTDITKAHNNMNLNNFRYGIRGQFGYRGLDMFINYDLNELFETGKGPATLNAISFGFVL